MTGEILYVKPGWIVMREHDVKSLRGFPGQHGAVRCAEGMLVDGGQVVVLNDDDKVTQVVEVSGGGKFKVHHPESPEADFIIAERDRLRDERDRLRDRCLDASIVIHRLREAIWFLRSSANAEDVVRRGLEAAEEWTGAKRPARKSAFAEWRENLFHRATRCPTCGAEEFPRKDEHGEDGMDVK